MSDLRDLYQQVIIDHGRHPRNFGTLSTATVIKEGFNPLCGDKLTLYLQLENQRIVDIKFEGSGCAISMASTSLMTQLLLDKTITEAEQLFSLFHQLMTQGQVEDPLHQLGKLTVLAGVAEYPARVKCATLCWHTLDAAVHGHPQTISTE